MRLLFCGDVVGRSGRDALLAALPDLRSRLAIDFVVVNGENAAHGFGITMKLAQDMFEAGADVVTTGNHVWAQRELITQITAEPRILRPENFPPGTPGRGFGVFPARDGRKVLVVNMLARVFMESLDDPFAAMERILRAHRLGDTVAAAVVDFHGEATSEKVAMGHHLDGRVSLVVGTHSHIPTADWQVLPGGTAYQSDAGMCGDYDSVIGMSKQESLRRFLTQMPSGRMTPAQGEATLCGLFVETDDATGLARKVEPLRLGGRLAQAMPGTGAP
ncbi:MAG: TIGR00282 family metallophosphoesterase [Acetobacterales bacterium]